MTWPGPSTCAAPASTTTPSSSPALISQAGAGSSWAKARSAPSWPSALAQDGRAGQALPRRRPGPARPAPRPKVLIDPAASPWACAGPSCAGVLETITRHLPPSQKNAGGAATSPKPAQDGAAMCRFYAWLEQTLGRGTSANSTSTPASPPSAPGATTSPWLLDHRRLQRQRRHAHYRATPGRLPRSHQDRPVRARPLN